MITLQTALSVEIKEKRIMAEEKFKVLEVIDGEEYIFDADRFREELRRVSRIAKKNHLVKSIEEYREVFAERIMVSSSALKQWETGRNGVSDLERIKEIAQHLHINDYRELLKCKSLPMKKEKNVMENIYFEKEKEVAREIYNEMVDFICLYEESFGFTEFLYVIDCTCSEHALSITQELERTIRKARFDLPEEVCKGLSELCWDIAGDSSETTSQDFEEEIDINRKKENYLNRLNEIMKDYIR